MSDKQKLVEDVVLALIRAGVLKIGEVEVANMTPTELVEVVTTRVQLVKTLIEQVSARVR